MAIETTKKTIRIMIAKFGANIANQKAYGNRYGDMLCVQYAGVAIDGVYSCVRI